MDSFFATARSPRPRAEVLPIRTMDLETVCAFLVECQTGTRDPIPPVAPPHANRATGSALSPAAWKNAYAQTWMTSPPNHGFMLVDEDRVVGAFMALHAERLIRGRLEKFCHLGHWVVLEGYRGQSLSLLRALKAQPDTHFTLFNANETVARILTTQRFVRLSDRISALSTLRWPGGFTSRVIVDRHEILTALPPEAAQACRHHRPFPWLRQLALGDRHGYCHIIHKPFKQGRFQSTNLLHISDGERFMRHYPALARHLLFKEGITSLRVPNRLLPAPLPGAREQRDPCARLFLSNRLGEADISGLYSDWMTRDIQSCGLS
ncbi:hypothetical protein SIID45300_01850 [Candidatus Magnetaquicoccaceae bacterium FCR-1]|uniref:N-acetyltransferase domain-containing protein n=1 Tax=Candidatus Magnetaquiglobus chichijimensis TaxID=3141448 RepID=A0ABQ0C9G8_9PROT